MTKFNQKHLSLFRSLLLTLPQTLRSRFWRHTRSTRPCNEWLWSQKRRARPFSTSTSREPQKRSLHSVVQRQVCHCISEANYKHLRLLLTLTIFVPVPADFATNLQLYTKQGLRVIAAAYKSLNANTKFKDADDMPRLELEQKCEFLGLIIMQVNNKTKV